MNKKTGIDINIETGTGTVHWPWATWDQMEIGEKNKKPEDAPPFYVSEPFVKGVEAGECFMLGIEVEEGKDFPDVLKSPLKGPWIDALQIIMRGRDMKVSLETEDVAKGTVTLIMRTTFYALPSGEIGCIVGGIGFSIADASDGENWKKIQARNERYEFELPEELSPLYVEEESAPENTDSEALILTSEGQETKKRRTTPAPTRTPLQYGNSFSMPTGNVVIAFTRMVQREFNIIEGDRNTVMSLGEEGEQMTVGCDGLEPEAVIKRVAERGAGFVQALYAHAAAWHKAMKGQPYYKPLDINFNDFLRFQGVPEKKNGGYSFDDIKTRLEATRFLRDMKIRVKTHRYKPDPKRPGKEIYIEEMVEMPVLVVEAIAQQRVFEMDGQERAETWFIRYHLPEPIYNCFFGKPRQMIEANSKFLRYHSRLQKYHILFSVALLNDWRKNVNNDLYKTPTGEPIRITARRIKMKALLDLAAITLPIANPGRTLEAIQNAISDMAQDKIVPGLRFEIAICPKGTVRDILLQSSVVYYIAPLPKADEGNQLAA